MTVRDSATKQRGNSKSEPQNPKQIRNPKSAGLKRRNEVVALPCTTISRPLFGCVASLVVKPETTDARSVGDLVVKTRNHRREVGGGLSCQNPKPPTRGRLNLSHLNLFRTSDFMLRI